MAHKYLDSPLGSLDSERLAKDGLATLFRAMIAAAGREALAKRGQEYLDQLHGPTKILYEFAIELASVESETWVFLPRLGGGEERWFAEKETADRYQHHADTAVLFTRMHGFDGFDAKLVTGYVTWGIDDEDRLPKLGTMPMYFTAGDDFASRDEPSNRPLDVFLHTAESAGYRVQSTQSQRMDVAAPGMMGGSTTVWRMVYEGQRKKRGSKIAGGYVGG